MVMDLALASVAAQFKRACNGLDIRDKAKTRALIVVLELSAQSLAQSTASRADAGSDLKVWVELRKIWRDLARTQLSFWENDDSEDEEEGDSYEDVLVIAREKDSEPSENSLRSLCSSLAKFTRNLVAGVPSNQARAFENEPDIRRLLHYYTSWSAMEDNESVITARLLTQALSNTVTGNDELVEKLWDSYMALPEDQVVLIRLMGSPDAKTLLTTLIFILNCIHASRKRTERMARSPVGIRILIGLLDNMVKLHEADEGSEAAKAFDIGYAVFTQFIEAGLVPELYKGFSVKSEIITPHQTTLLKLVDSYLQSMQLDPTTVQIPEIMQTHEALGSFLARRFFALSEYAQETIHRSLGMAMPSRSSDAGRSSSESSSAGLSSSSSTSSSSSSSSSFEQITYPPLNQLDVMLPKVCESLVLITQCMTNISLEASEQRVRLQAGLSSFRDYRDMKAYFNSKKHRGKGVVECLVDLLSLLDVFLPRINFGKPVPSAGAPSSSTTASSSSSSATPAPAIPGTDKASGFSYLKRDLVRLLGVLAHEEKAVQDRTREAGGLPVVMNLCVVDERNPYLREHAIFTLHTLLKNNPENKRFVDSVKPSREWDQDGTLRTRVGSGTAK